MPLFFFTNLTHLSLVVNQGLSFLERVSNRWMSQPLLLTKTVGSSIVVSTEQYKNVFKNLKVNKVNPAELQYVWSVLIVTHYTLSLDVFLFSQIVPG